MSNIQNLNAGEAVEKMRTLVKAAPTCMLETGLSSVPFHTCPMQAQQVDNAGSIWFFSGADSTHHADLASDPRVQLVFSNNAHYEFLTVFGRAEISTDRSKIDELWDKTVEAWFPGGKDDPNLRLIRVSPEMSHYWATKDGKIVTLAKMVASAVAGKIPDVGVHGDLRVH